MSNYEYHSVDNYYFFWRAWHPFSNWHKSYFRIGEKGYCCVEQYMMFKKAELFKDQDSANKIMATEHPREHRNLGRKVKNFVEEIWEEDKYFIVVEGCKAKFSQNDHLKRILLDTNDKVLVEASPYDRIWGIGYDQSEAMLNIDNWGKNLLGKALMEVRNQLK